MEVFANKSEETEVLAKIWRQAQSIHEIDRYSKFLLQKGPLKF